MSGEIPLKLRERKFIRPHFDTSENFFLKAGDFASMHLLLILLGSMLGFEYALKQHLFIRRPVNAALLSLKVPRTLQSWQSSAYSASSLHSTSSDDNEDPSSSFQNPTGSPNDNVKYMNPPLKAHIFIDGTWLYYGLIKGRFNNDPMTRKLGPHWERRYRILYPEICNVIAKDLKKQLERKNENTNRDVEIIRTNVFTSMKIG